MHQIPNPCQPLVEAHRTCVCYSLKDISMSKQASCSSTEGQEKGRNQKNAMIVILLPAPVRGFQHLRIHNIDGSTGRIGDDLVEDVRELSFVLLARDIPDVRRAYDIIH